MAPILRTDDCDGCNENAARGRSSHVVASLGTMSWLVLWETPEGCSVREIRSHPPRTQTEGSGARLMRSRGKYSGGNRPKHTRVRLWKIRKKEKKKEKE